MNHSFHWPWNQAHSIQITLPGHYNFIILLQRINYVIVQYIGADLAVTFYAWRVANTIPIHSNIQYIPRNMHTALALLCYVLVIHWLIFPYPSGLLHWHCGNLTIAPVPAKQPWWIWINTSCEFIMNDCITTTKQSTTKPCAHFLGYTVPSFFNISITTAAFSKFAG